MKKHLKLKITGKVQGVWYRSSFEKEAKELGINGFVRNEPDGSVYAEVEGDELLLKKLVDWCWQGPKMANVKQVFIEEGPISGFSTFDIQK